MFYAGQNDRVAVREVDDTRYESRCEAEHDGGTASGPVGGSVKRALDIVVALTALVLLLPLIALVSLLVLVTMGRPILERRKRIGFAGRDFTDFTFRTDFETPTGKLLKNSGIDGLPRLVNVLKGEMSCVGPRPLVADELQRYGNRIGNYVRARPGMTGTWQVNGNEVCDGETSISLDGTYVHNWSMQGDILILLKTIPAVMRADQSP